jgi:hypothetical protein
VDRRYHPALRTMSTITIIPRRNVDRRYHPALRTMSTITIIPRRNVDRHYHPALRTMSTFTIIPWRKCRPTLSSPPSLTGASPENRHDRTSAWDRRAPARPTPQWRHPQPVSRP